MKTFLIFLGFIMIPFFSSSQELTKIIDTMTDKIYFVDSGTFYLDEANDQGFRLDGLWKMNSEVPIFEGFTAKVVGIGGCVEKVTMIMQLENGEKITKVSWNKFNCEGNCFFRFTPDEIKLLQTIPITRVRFQNGRTYEQMTGEPNNPRFFIEINQKAKEGGFKVIKE